jgi:hypothetical protein
VTVLPQLTPATDLGAAGATAYAQRQGTTLATFTDALQPILTPEQVGRDVVSFLADASGPAHAEYLLTGRGPELLS